MSTRCLPLLACASAVFLLTSPPAAAQSPLINELMASNATTIADEDGDYSDWIELYNPGDSPFDLGGCYLSDDAGNPLRWQFPAGVIEPQGFLLVWASGKDRHSPSGELHTSFAISSSGEPLLLTAADGVTRLDEVGPVVLSTDVSYGRLPDGAAQWVFFGAPTPGAANSGGLLYLEAPGFSQAPGFFTGAIDLALTAADPEVEIRYTLDGSEPAPGSPLYEGPLPLGGRQGDPNVISLIPTNFISGHDGWRPPRGEVFKINVVRARAFRPGHAPSAITTGSFIIDPDPAGRLHLPVVSLATSPENLFDDEIGIYVPGILHNPADPIWSGNYHQRGEDWERPMHIELFDPQGSRILAQDGGARIHGHRTRYFPQKTLRLYARSLYGPSSFDCALFPDLPYDSYKRFLIRNSGQDWARKGFLDLVLQTICADMGFDTQAGRPVVHFINGEYWGLANMRERYDRHYIARCYGVPEDEVAILERDAYISEGQPVDRQHYLSMREFVVTSDMTDPASLAYVAERMDLENFIAYNVAEIYAANRDWPGNNIRFWRRRLPVYDPEAPYGHDGRWRWMMFDMDFYLSSPSHNTLEHATATNGPIWPNPPWSTELLRGLLGNETFRHDFINAFADHLSSTFMPARLIGIIDQFADLYAPAIPEWYDRWDVTYSWATAVQNMRNFVTNRPGYVRQHVINYFSLYFAAEVTRDVNDPARGKLRLNQLVIDSDLPGLPDPAQPYPWTGIYFQGVPITATALPGPGQRFVAWQHNGSTDPVLTVTPGPDLEPLVLTAIFTQDTSLPVAVHAWHFNDLPSGALSEVPADLSLPGGAVITYPGSGSGYIDRVSDGTELGGLPDTPAGYALRVRNPSDTRELVAAVPSSGHGELSLGYAVKRTTNGAERHSVYCRIEPQGDWHLVADSVAVGEAYQLLTHDLSTLAGTADNQHLAVKFVFGGPSAGGDSGNQRFDNITLTGVVLPGANLPPQVAGPVGLRQALEGGQGLTIDLDEVFDDPEGDPLVYLAESGDSSTAGVSVSGSQLTVTPLLRGDVWIVVSAVDGYNDPVPHSFRVLIYPSAAVLRDSAFSFSEWDPDLPERTYPEHMLFLQSAVSDPGLGEPLLFPYYIPHDDYHADDQGTIGYPYNNTGRTRINGLGQDGISFINTGRGRDLGGALLTVDTRVLERAEVSWLAGTVLPNSRVYALRLQYRVGLEGVFEDLLVGGEPLEYLRGESAGDVQDFGPLELPEELLGHCCLQLLWRYYYVEEGSGPRAELRLGRIHLEGTVVPTAAEAPPPPAVSALHSVAPNPFNPAVTISFSVRAGETGRLEIYNARGQRVRLLGEFPPGEHRLSWDGTNQAGRRCASGVYFCRLGTGSGNWIRKIVLMK